MTHLDILLTCASNSSWRHTLRSHTSLQHTATHCNMLQRTATHSSWSHTLRSHVSVQHTATHCNALQHTAIHCNTLVQEPYIHTQQTLCNTLQHSAKHSATHSTIHCNTLQCTRISHTYTHTPARALIFTPSALSRPPSPRALTPIQTSTKKSESLMILASPHSSVAVCCSVLQCVAVRCSVLQCDRSLTQTHKDQ